MDKKWYQKGLDWLLEKENVGKKWYKRRIVWVAAVVVVVLIMLLNPESKPTEKKQITGDEIPNVFGVYYEDAIDVLEAEGFEVKAIETDAKSILNNLYKEYDGSPQYYGDRPESYEKGSVFKINDYTQDGVGQLYDNDDMYDEQMVDDDGKIVIYYAKEAYSGSDGTINDNSEEENSDVTDETTTTEDEQTTTDTTTKESEKKETNSGGIRADFKSAMDSYEKFFDEYVAIMKKYANNPSDMSILGDYTKYMGKYAQMMGDFEKWESEDMNAAETAYYLEVQGRITKKLLEVAQ